MSKVMYMHTIDGCPAFFVKGEQIYFIRSYHKPEKALVSSLEQIKREQKLSMAWRVKQGWDKTPNKKEYGWIKILI